MAGSGIYWATMERVTVVASFRDSQAADAAALRFVDASSRTDQTAGTSLLATGREGRFMVRLVLIVAGWSVAGTAIGGAVGALLSYTVGPHGTEGLILQVVSWAIFAHLLIGLWAGYALLADRSGRELADQEATLSIEVSRDDAPLLARKLQEAGASKVVIQSNASAGALVRR
jgi:hypothetical protein